MKPIDNLVIGASGPIGIRLMGALNAKTGISLGVSRTLPERLDIFDHEQTSEVLHSLKPRNVIYLASPTAGELDARSDLAGQTVSAVGRIATLCKEVGSEKFVFLSSAAVYGTSLWRPLIEDDPLDGEGAYAESKKLSEIAAAIALSGSSTQLAVLRVFNVYGPGCSSSLLNRLEFPETKVWETESFVRDYVHVDDVVRAILLALEYQGTVTIFNIGSGRPTSNKDLIETTKTWASFARLAYSGPPSSSVADLTRSSQELGYVPKAALEFM